MVTTSVVAAPGRKTVSPRAETYESATVDATGRLVIVKTTGQRALVRNDAEQTVFSSPMLSPARTAVAAEAMFANCCTSYDIPLQLVVYAAGRVHRFTGVGLPIARSGFGDGEHESPTARTRRQRQIGSRR